MIYFRIPSWIVGNEEAAAKTSRLVFCTYLPCIVPLAVENIIEAMHNGWWLFSQWRVFIYYIYWQLYYLNNLIYTMRIRIYRRYFMNFVDKWIYKRTVLWEVRGDDQRVLRLSTESVVTRRENRSVVYFIPCV